MGIDKQTKVVQESVGARRIAFRDTTLREGIQIPGSRISQEHQHQFIALLEETGVAEIEVGLPDGVAACVGLADLIREHHYSIKATALLPCYTEHWRRQVDLAGEHGIHRIDILTPTSDCLLSDTTHYGMRADEIFQRIESVIIYARPTSLELGVGLMDATRAPVERLLDLVRPLKGLGVSRLVVYDSVGIMIPSRMTPFIERIHEASGLPILVHCHNDHGMATANSLAAVEGGAEFIDVAVNGLGGRAGNAALEEVAVALENIYCLPTGIRLGRLRELSLFVQRMTGLKIWPLKPVVGDFCFVHIPVMHIRCIAGGNPSAFEPFDPEQVGARRTYGFSLPVDYIATLEPFIRKSGCSPQPEDIGRILKILKDGNDRIGWTEEQILQLIGRESRTAEA